MPYCFFITGNFILPIKAVLKNVMVKCLKLQANGKNTLKYKIKD